MSKIQKIRHGERPEDGPVESLREATGERHLLTRRELLQSGLIAVASSISVFQLADARNKFIHGSNSGETAYVRPPGALEEREFLSKCIRCNQCSDVCENDCIRYLRGGSGDATPYIIPRAKGCILCMKCTHACPSGALTPIGNGTDDILRKVRMGTAVVDKNICNSYNGGVCGVCIRACPFPEIALKTGPWERPIVDTDKCVGCGLCENRCIVYPQAIRVTPASKGKRPSRS